MLWGFGMWLTRSVSEDGNPAPGGLSINPCLRHIHGRDSPPPLSPDVFNQVNITITLYYSRAYPKTHPIMSRWVYALTFLRSVLGIKSGDRFKAYILPQWAHGGFLLISALSACLAVYAACCIWFLLNSPNTNSALYSVCFFTRL